VGCAGLRGAAYCDRSARPFSPRIARALRAGVKDQRHAVAGWNFYQATRSFGFLVLIRTADDCGWLVNYRPLFVNRKFRVTNNVDEKDMRDFEPNLLFNLGRQVMNLPEIKIIDNSASRRRFNTKGGLRTLSAWPSEFRTKISHTLYIDRPPSCAGRPTTSWQPRLAPMQ
jgi:hypothetical protein